jgi:DNA polymerase-3 subunit epsilon
VTTISVIDCETTGLGKSDRIVELAIVTLDAKTLETVDEFDTLLNPCRDVGKTSIHGITPSMVAAAPAMEEVIGAVSKRLNGSILAAHNLSFDSRMLDSECRRLRAEFEPGKGICTLRLSGEKLASAAERFGIRLAGHHRALADARACAGLIRRLMEDEPQISPARMVVSGAQNSARTLRRDITDPDQVTPLRRLTMRSCIPSSIGACLDYFDALDWVLDDGVISSDEKAFLAEIINASNLSETQIMAMHESYIQSLTQAIERDNFVTVEERLLLGRVATALGVQNVVLPELTETPDAGEIRRGQRVCFTGTAVDAEGNTIERETLERLAAQAGLQPVSSVTKKSCDLLVASDSASTSGKARKARDYGVPVIDVAAFLNELGYGESPKQTL